MSTQILALSNGDRQNLEQISLWLSENGFEVLSAESGAKAIAELEAKTFGALILEPVLPDLMCADIIQQAQHIAPSMAVFIVDPAAMSVSGVAVPGDSLSKHIQSLLENVGRKGYNTRPAARGRSRSDRALPGIIGSHQEMKALYHAVRLVAPRQTTVLIQGESGTGKELVARAIHEVSPRGEGPWVVVNCAAIPDGLLESEIFGHVRGAFTGAVQSHLGKVHAANKGTLFLDEVGELPLGVQAKLLRFLQEHEVQRLGSTDIFKVDVRVIAATNVDLETRCAEGRFREDLYHRLNVFPITVPPLRERTCDIAALASAFLEGLALENKEPCKSLTQSCVRLIESCSWPGNVRELRNALERACIMAEDEKILEPVHFSFLIQERAESLNA